MKDKRTIGKATIRSYKAMIALTIVYFVGKNLLKKRNHRQKGRQCSHCQKVPARIRLVRMIDGCHESHFLCSSCLSKLKGKNMLCILL